LKSELGTATNFAEFILSGFLHLQQQPTSPFTFAVPSMKVTEVNSPHRIRGFLEVPVSIYQNDPNWIRPLDQDIENVFDEKKNKLFRHGKARRWILSNDDGTYIGRIAAFINEQTARQSEYVAGGIGFFECINNQDAANLLFITARDWLAQFGMEAMDGPINFGDRQAWWGLQVEGFAPPTYQMNYNPPYYINLFENYGFRLYFDQLVFNYEVAKPVPESFQQKAERIFKSPAFEFSHLKKKMLKKYAADITSIYNEAWAGMGHFRKVNEEQTLNTLRKMLPVMDEKLIWFGYYKSKPVAFFIMLPEINQIIRHLNGKMNWWSKLKFFYYQRTGKVNKMFGVLFGVVPDFQGKGIDGAVIMAAAKVIQPMNKYLNLEMNWVGDFNPKMIKMVENLGTTVCKRYRTYRYLFDRSKPFTRYPIMH
jgi:GNAT superfamily N-acetyltransferase